jgi:hypothetical protein
VNVADEMFGTKENGVHDPLRYDAHADAPQEDMKTESKDNLARDYASKPEHSCARWQAGFASAEAAHAVRRHPIVPEQLRTRVVSDLRLIDGGLRSRRRRVDERFELARIGESYVDNLYNSLLVP